MALWNICILLIFGLSVEGRRVGYRCFAVQIVIAIVTSCLHVIGNSVHVVSKVRRIF